MSVSPFLKKTAFYISVFFLSLTSLTFAEVPQGAIPTDPEINPDGLQKFKTFLADNRSRAAIVIHKGIVAGEWYWFDTKPDEAMECWSMSKSMASTAIGFLIDEGKIKSIDEPVSKYIPEWMGTDKEKIPISNILDQVSGIKELIGLQTPKGMQTTCITAPLIEPPGEKHRYNNTGCNLLSSIIKSAAGKDAEEYMREKLWKPIGMINTSWRRDDDGNVITYAGIQSTVRDWAKFGDLLLHNGQWNGKQILSKSWIDAATNKRTHLTIPGVGPSSDYGLLWWLDFHKDTVGHNFSALGLWGNQLTVIPEKQLIAARLVGNHTDGGALMRMVPEWVEALDGVLKK